MSEWRRRYPYWRQLLDSDWSKWTSYVNSAHPDGIGSQRILVATGTGGTPIISTIDSMLGAALTTRGGNVTFLLCDGILPACFEAYAGRVDIKDYADHGPPKSMCGNCYEPAQEMFSDLGLAVLKLSDYLEPCDYREASDTARDIGYSQISSFVRARVPVGDFAMSNTLRFFVRADLEGEPHAEQVLRRYLRAAILVQTATNRLLQEKRIQTLVGAHGMYIPDGVIFATAESIGVHAVNWKRGYRTSTLALAHHQPFHVDLVDEPTSKWENLPWSAWLEDTIGEYLESRITGKDWVAFNHDDEVSDISVVEEAYGLSFAKPTIGLGTNVAWDARLFYPGQAFANMVEWVLATIEYFRHRPDLQLLIRVHPAEVRNSLPTRRPLVQEIEEKIGQLPANVRVIPPEAKVDTYAVLRACKAVLFYGSIIGLEMACCGIPTICAGGFVWLRNKGFTVDVQSAQEYFAELDRLPYAEDPGRQEKMSRARKYAFHFFFRRGIPVQCLQAGEGHTCLIKLENGLSSLEPGADAGLDLICRGILQREDFIFPAETALNPDTGHALDVNVGRPG